jgi:hypothetical protein
MNAIATAASLEAVTAPVGEAPAPAIASGPGDRSSSRSWLRCGVAQRVAAGLLAAGGLWLMVAWAMSAPGVS